MAPVLYERAFISNENHDFSLYPVLYFALPNIYTQFTTALFTKQVVPEAVKQTGFLLICVLCS